MTNAEKYLKEGVSVEEFAYAYAHVEQEALNGIHPCNIKHFLQQPVQPTLTEDERVILRNIQKLEKIHRANNGNLVLCFESGYNYHITWLNPHLFQFIKERRRIRDKGVIGRKMTEYYIKYYKEHKKEILERVKKYYTKNKDKILSQRRKNSSRAEQIFLQDKKLKGSTILEIIRAKPKRYICMCNCGSKFEITSKRISVLLMQDKFIVCQKCRTEKAKDKRQKVRKVAYT